MSKRDFRRDSDPKQRPGYPTLDEFEGDRRAFLRRFGATVIGGGILAAGLAGCGERAVGGKSKKDAQQLAGVPRQPDAQVDGGPPEPDGPIGPSGAAPSPDAQLDKGKPKKDMLLGDPAQPDACIDKVDQGPIAGGAPMPDSRKDQVDQGLPSPGFAPPMDAAIDMKKPPKP